MEVFKNEVADIGLEMVAELNSHRPLTFQGGVGVQGFSLEM